MGAYRFFRNPKVTMPGLPEAHRQAVIERMTAHAREVSSQAGFPKQASLLGQGLSTLSTSVEISPYWKPVAPGGVVSK